MNERRLCDRRIQSGMNTHHCCEAPHRSAEHVCVCGHRWVEREQAVSS